MSMVEQRRLSFDERVTLKKLIDEKTRQAKRIVTSEAKRYRYPSYLKEWELERRIKDLAQDGLVIHRDNDDYIVCMHCHKRSSKLTKKDKRHEPNCPRTPLEMVGYTDGV